MRFLLLLTVLVSPVSAAIAPDSITGKVLRTNATWKGTSPRYRSEYTIIFKDSIHYVFLKYAIGLDFITWNFAKAEIQEPRADGEYLYQKLSDTSALVTLIGERQVPPMRLDFTSPTGGGGTWPPEPSPFSGPVSFFLTDLPPENALAPNNVSMRGKVAPGQPLIVGFMIPGTAAPSRTENETVPSFGEKAQEVLIRIVGPSLRSFGIESPWADPDFELFRDGKQAFVDEKPSGDWDSASGTGLGLRKIFQYVGAFPLLAQSKDAVAVFRLTPGNYTIVCTCPSSDAGGEALVEVYFLP